MSRSLVRESLTVVIAGDEVPGVIVFALFEPGLVNEGPLIPSRTLAVDRARPFMLHGPRWRVLTWDVPIATWQTLAEVTSDIRSTLADLVDRGAQVAWVGAEGLPFVDPPDLFEPAYMTGSVLAWLTSSGDFGCMIDPDRPFPSADDDVLRRLRRHSAGLSDAPD